MADKLVYTPIDDTQNTSSVDLNQWWKRFNLTLNLMK